MLKKFVSIIGGDPNKREIENLSETVDQINSLEPVLESLSDNELRSKTDEFRSRLTEGETLEEILPEAFAVVREASKRTIGLRHFDVQLIGGIVLHQGRIAEMRTGEGKTLVATLPLYLNAISGKGVHLITVNDYLARRDARWMGPIYNLLGLSVGVLQIAARTENGKKAFLVDIERESPHEDQHHLRMVSRQEAYAADLTYGTNSEFGFDYLRDNMTMRWEDRVQRGHHYAIVDEVDNVLIDEARTPLIISGPAQDEAPWYIRMAQVVKSLRVDDIEVNDKDRTVTLTEMGEGHIEELLNMPLRDPDRPEDVTLEQARVLGYLEQALRAQHLFRRNKDYLVQAGKVIIVDEFTGRMMPGRRWSDGLHQAVEAKEGVRVQNESVTYATITIQNYFRMYEKLAGMSGTALTESEEFDKIYKLGVLAIPTNLEYQAMRPESNLLELETRDEKGYKFQYYYIADDPEKNPVYWKRKDHPDVIYRTEDAKLRAITREILRNHVSGRPLLVGTTSVELSERLSARLRAEPLRRLSQVSLLRDGWIRENKYQEDGRVIQELQFLNEPLDKLDTNAMRKLARDLEIPFNPEEPANLNRLLFLLELPDQVKERLSADLAAGISHQVLNARKHTEESQIIASAGAFGAVTIATNMAGRGVDIRLGGELAEEVIIAVNRILSRNGFSDPYDMTMQERRQALLQINPADYGIYESEVNYYLKHMEEMEQVRTLGGLHIIGSERHEARRIDNQLRGRSARQGDPGSSRFYLSMQDDLMRLFGGQQAEALMERMKWDDALPLEIGVVGRLIEQSQTRVEGANFDVRKHLLDYDDVLNTQRASIYTQRDRIFTKEDLTEDVTEMLQTEVLRRVPEALQDEGGPWKLLSWLDQIQPSINIGNVIFPSYTLHLLLDQIANRFKTDGNALPLKQILLDIAHSSLEAENQHQMKAFAGLIEQTGSRIEGQIEDHSEAIDVFLEELAHQDETEGETRRPSEILTELSNISRMPIKLTSEEQQALKDNPEVLSDTIHNQVKTAFYNQTISRLVGAIELRLGEPLDFPPLEFSREDWHELSDRILNAANQILDTRVERLIGQDGNYSGQIAKDLDNILSRLTGPITEQMIVALLLQIPQGSRSLFDKRTHRRVFQHTTRLNYVYHAAHFLEDRQFKEIADQVLNHLEQAQKFIQQAWSLTEFSRLRNVTLAELQTSNVLSEIENLGIESGPPLLDQQLINLPEEQKRLVIDELGRRALTGVYRQLLLGVITELWVDYLTQMEALRVSIGFESYAQRDPLVQYKNRAYELFQELIQNVRTGVVSHMFTYRPHDLSTVQASVTSPEISQAGSTEAIETPLVELESDQSNQDIVDNSTEKLPEKRTLSPTDQPSREGGSKKRRRRRH
jgi:preprotein translocase subunit SecA